MFSFFFRLDSVTVERHDPEDDLVFVEIRRPERPLATSRADQPLPDWLDLALCIAAPVVVSVAVLLLFRAGALFTAASS
jgi:hypothetical protein